MIIKAKFTSRCDVCGEDIDEGEEIEWTKGEPPSHRQCFEDQKANEACPVKPVQHGVTVRFNPPKGTQ